MAILYIKNPSFTNKTIIFGEKYAQFTNFILLFSAFSLLSTHISAQNADIELLRTINSSTQTVDYSRFISNTTTGVAIGVPVIMGAMALIEQDDNLLKTLFM